MVSTAADTPVWPCLSQTDIRFAGLPDCSGRPLEIGFLLESLEILAERLVLGVNFEELLKVETGVILVAGLEVIVGDVVERALVGIHILGAVGGVLVIGGNHGLIGLYEFGKKPLKLKMCLD